MAYSFSVALQTYEKVVVIGTDCPDIDEGYLQQAFEILKEVDSPAAEPVSQMLEALEAV